MKVGRKVATTMITVNGTNMEIRTKKKKNF